MRNQLYNLEREIYGNYKRMQELSDIERNAIEKIGDSIRREGTYLDINRLPKLIKTLKEYSIEKGGELEITISNHYGYQYHFSGDISFHMRLPNGKFDRLCLWDTRDLDSFHSGFSYPTNVLFSGKISIDGLIEMYTVFPKDSIGKLSYIGNGDVNNKGKGIEFLFEHALELEAPMPNTLILKTDIEKRFYEHNRISDFNDGEIQRKILDGTFSESVMSEISDVIRDYKSPLVVRSDADEGKKATSSSGIYKSFFCGNNSHLETAIKKVLASKYSEDAKEYREQRGIEDVAMSIIIQEVIMQEKISNLNKIDKSYLNAPFISGIVTSQLKYNKDFAEIFAGYGFSTRFLDAGEDLSSYMVLISGHEKYDILDILGDERDWKRIVKQDSMDVIDMNTGKVISVPLPRKYTDSGSDIFEKFDYTKPINMALKIQRMRGSRIIMEYAMAKINEKYWAVPIQIDDLKDTELQEVNINPNTSIDKIIAKSTNTMGHGEKSINNVIYIPYSYDCATRDDAVAMYSKLTELNKKLQGYLLIVNDQIGSAINKTEERQITYSTISNVGVIVEEIEENKLARPSNCKHLGRVLEEQGVLYMSAMSINSEILTKDFEHKTFDFGGAKMYLIYTNADVLAQIDSRRGKRGLGLITLKE